MATGALQRSKGWHNTGVVEFVTSASIAADASVSASNNSIVGTWSKVSDGLYRFTSAGTFCTSSNAFVHAFPSFVAATAVDLVPQVKSKSISSTTGVLTIDVNLLAGGVATAVSAVCELSLLVVVKDSSAAP